MTFCRPSGTCVNSGSIKITTKPLMKFDSAIQGGSFVLIAGMLAAFFAPLEQAEWVVYAKRPFAGLQAVLAYLSRYTHRVAISNRRLVSTDQSSVTFKWKD